MQEKISSQRPVSNTTRDSLLDLPTKEEEPCNESLETCIEIVGQPLEKDDYEMCEKDKAVKLRCRLCWWALMILLVYFLSEYYFKRLFSVY